MGVFDYEIPKNAAIEIGQLVTIPFRKKKIIGLVSDIHEGKYKGTLKPIEKVINETPLLPKSYLEVIKEIAQVYGISQGSAAMMFLPPLQARALAHAIIKPWDGENTDSPTVRLLQYYHETALYEHLTSMIKPDAHTLIVVPRVSDVAAMHRIFPEAIVWDSSRSQKEQRESWLGTRNGHQMMIGTRSAIFVPMPKQKHIIIIDEESQDHKNWDAQPRYRIFDIARRIQKINQADIILCSKTPRMSTIAHVSAHNMKQLEHRPKTHMTIVDMAKEKNAKNYSVLSTPLSNAIEQAIESGQSACILSQKKGYAHILRCKDCALIISCNTCSLPLTHIKGMLECNHCREKQKQPEACPQCNANSFAYQSPGIEQIAQLCDEQYGSRAEVLSISAEEAYTAAPTERSRIIVGTTAALSVIPYESTSVYGVIDIDIMLRQPEYDASEKALILMNELIYHADRNTSPHIIIQTHNPHHPVCDALVGTTLKQWYAQENELRQILCYPPYSKLMKITIEHEHAREWANNVARAIKEYDPFVYHLEREGRRKNMKMGILIKLNPKTWWKQAQHITQHLPPQAIIDIDPISVLS